MDKIWWWAFAIVGIFIFATLFTAFKIPREFIEGSDEGIKLSPGETINQGLEIYYPFDNHANGVTPDMSGNNRDGAVTNGYLANTIYGKAMQFNGQHYVNVTGQDINTGNAFTASSWIKLDNNAFSENNEVIFSDQFPGNWPSVMMHIINSSGNVSLKIHRSNSQTDVFFVSSNISLSKGVWYNIVGKLENNNLSIYINGFLKGRKSGQNGVPYNSDRGFYVGSNYGETLFLHGALNDLRFYNRALTEEEILYLANASNIPSHFGVGLPTISLVSPLSGSAFRSANVEFKANLSDDVLLSNATFLIWNSTDNLINSQFVQLSGAFQAVSVNYALPYTGDFKWAFKVVDSEGNSTISSNSTVFYDSTLPLITITNPLNRSYNDSVNSLQFSATDAHLDRCWYSLNNGLTNNSVACNEQVNAFATNGNHNWVVYVNDSAGNFNMSRVIFSVDDDSPPIIDVDTPTNRSYLASSLLFEIKLNEKGRAWFSLDGGNSIDMNTTNNRTFTYRVDDLTRGSHVVMFSAEDIQDNLREVSVVFGVNAGSSNGTSGSGSTGTGTTGTATGTGSTAGVTTTSGTTGTGSGAGSSGGYVEEEVGGSDEMSGLFWIIVGLVVLAAAIVVVIIVILVVHRSKQQVQRAQGYGQQQPRQSGVVVSGNTGNNFR